MTLRLLNCGIALSLLLCVTACVLWICSYAAPVSVGRRTWRVGGSPTAVVTEVGFASAPGRLALGTRSRQFPTDATGPSRGTVQWFCGPSALGDSVRHRAWHGPLGFEFGFSLAAP